MNARHIASGLIGLAVLGLVVGIASTWLAPSPKRIAHDSYSGTIPGHRAVLETLEALGVPARRNEDVPSKLFAGNRRVLLIEPDFARLEREQDYLAQMETWIRGGGELVVVSATFKQVDDSPTASRRSKKCKISDTRGTFLARLGLDKLSVAEIAAPAKREGFQAALPKRVDIGGETLRGYPVRATGTLAPLGEILRELRLPSSVPGCFQGEAVADASDKIEIEMDPDVWQPIALEYARDAGRVIMLADPRPFRNLGIGEMDNGVLAYALAAGDGAREVVIDEFYHGPAVEGKTLALLGMYPYGVIALFVLAAALSWVWSGYVRFGPPVETDAVSRRSILEYIDAMARLLRRGRKETFVLRNCRDGFVADLRTELQLDISAPEPLVLTRLAQLDQRRVERLRDALANIDAALAAPERVTVNRLFILQEQLESCRSSKGHHPRARALTPSAPYTNAR